MSHPKVVITAMDMLTPYGKGLDLCWNGVLSGKRALQPVSHFDASRFQSSHAGIITDLDVNGPSSRVMAMLEALLPDAKRRIPRDALCILATTLGEIEYLERSVVRRDSDAARESRPSKLLSKIEQSLGLESAGYCVSAACASSNTAVAEAAERIRAGESSCCVVFACDSVSEFLLAGFSSLLALDQNFASPFDADRSGLTVGEAAGYAVLMSEDRARAERLAILGGVSGWGLSNDANHMTGPSRDGDGLARAIESSLNLAGVGKDAVASISAHGTGTIYNDSMEMKAFKRVFTGGPLPVYSVKGAIGHTMATAGLLEMMIVLRSLRERQAPGTVGLKKIDPEAEGWVSREVSDCSGEFALSTNSGFGGVNSALLLKGGER